jgi:hypothetical protein
VDRRGAPHRFRVVFQGPTPGVDSSSRAEYGGFLGSGSGLGYTTDGNALYPAPYRGRIAGTDLDPVAFVRRALRAGDARVEALATLAGRSVTRIRVGLRDRRAPVADYFVDPRTYRPIRIALLNGESIDPRQIGLPVAPAAFLPGKVHFGFAPGRGAYSLLCDFTGYRYLPRTAANRKLADIRAMHPTAKVL